ncbi:MAG: hypothetical protein ACK5O8_06385 [Pirellula sp.]
MFNCVAVKSSEKLNTITSVRYANRRFQAVQSNQALQSATPIAESLVSVGMAPEDALRGLARTLQFRGNSIRGPALHGTPWMK